MTSNDGDRIWTRLRVYSPNGVLLGTLSHPVSWEMAIPHNDMPSLTLSYHENLPGASLLRTPCEVAVELGGPDIGGYVEYPGCRFLNLKRSWNQTDRVAASSYTLPSYGWQLRKARFANTDNFNDQGRRVFAAGTVGKVLKAVLDEAKSRGNIPGLTYTFTDTLDSGGASWTDLMDIEFEAGQDAWSILDAFSRQGLCDWRMNVRALEVYKPDTVLFRNFADEGPNTVILHPNLDHTDEPTEETLEDLASSLVMIGDKKSVVVVNDISAIQPWGKWEETVRAGGVSNPITLTALGHKALLLRTNLRVQMTKDLTLRKGSPVPLVNYRPGDVVRARGATGFQMEPVRVRQITLSKESPYGLSCNVVLNDRFTDRQMKYEQWINTLTGQGGPGNGGGSDVDPLPPTPDPTPPDGALPAAPTGVTVTTTTYVDTIGRPVGQALVTWNPVTTDRDGNPLTPKGYQIATRRTDLQSGLDIGVWVEHPQVNGYIGPLDGGFSYRFQVTAMNSGGYLGDASATVIKAIPLSDVAPPKPSTPTLTSKLGTVRVQWDGLTSSGTAMPKDFTRILVQMSTTNGNPWTNIGEVFRGGSAVVTGAQTLGATRWFRFFAENSSALSSIVSDTASIAVVGVQGPDIEANTVTANNIAAGTITAEKIKAYSLSADRLSVGALNNVIADPMMANADLNAARLAMATRSDNTNSSLAWTVGTGSTLGATVTSLVPVGLGVFATARWPLINSTLLNMQVNAPSVSLDTLGAMTQIVQPLSVAAGVGNIKARIETWNVQGDAAWTATGYLEIRCYAQFYKRDGTRIGTTPTTLFTRSYTSANAVPHVVQSTAGGAVPDDAAAFHVYFYVLYNGLPKNAALTIVNPEVWQENSVYIGDGMVKAPLIEANAITTDKLAANAITVKHTLTGPLYQTSAPGSGLPRVEISPNVNFLNQAGMIITPSSGNSNLSAQLFLTDVAGTGGWKANSYVMVGPETTRNSSGRADYYAGVGGDWWLKKEYVDANSRFCGVEGYVDSNILALYGAMPTRTGDQAYLHGVLRAFEHWWFPGSAGSLSWGFDNGSYYKVQGSISSRDSSMAIINIEDVSTSGFSWRANQSPRRVNFLVYRNDITL
jgi:hypothetical protein